MSFNPDEPRDYHGRWGDGAGNNPAHAGDHAKSVPNFDTALRTVHNASDAELVNLSKDQRQTILSMALRQKALQLGKAFQP
jgi:hypothetical protein